MKLTAYKEMITMAKDKKDLLLAPVRTWKAKKQAELELAKIEEESATIKAGIEEECGKVDINFNRIIDKLNALGLCERKAKQFNKILAEMFPE